METYIKILHISNLTSNSVEIFFRSTYVRTVLQKESQDQVSKAINYEYFYKAN